MNEQHVTSETIDLLTKELEGLMSMNVNDEDPTLLRTFGNDQFYGAYRISRAASKRIKEFRLEALEEVSRELGVALIEFNKAASAAADEAQIALSKTRELLEKETAPNGQ